MSVVLTGETQPRIYRLWTEETENAEFWSLAEDEDVDVDEDEDWVVLYGTGQLIQVIPHVVEGEDYAPGIVYGDRLQKNHSNMGLQSPVTASKPNNSNDNYNKGLLFRV